MKMLDKVEFEEYNDEEPTGAFSLFGEVTRIKWDKMWTFRDGSTGCFFIIQQLVRLNNYCLHTVAVPLLYATDLSLKVCAVRLL